MPTRTGHFPIGFRRGWSDWQKADLALIARWAKENGFEAIDLGQATAEDTATLKSAGLALGSVDLIRAGEITHPDIAKRRETIAANVAYLNEAAGLGARIFFTIVGGDPGKKRAENYRIAV